MPRIVGSRSPIALTIAVAASILVATVEAVSAHGARLPFERWGGFSPGAVRCQRSIARAAARCAARTWDLRRACLTARLTGQPCEESTVTAAIEAARRAALDEVDASCSERQAIELQFLGAFDLQADIIAFCRDWEIAASSAVFGPVLDDPPPPPATLRCVNAAAAAASDAMHLVFRTRRSCMDRIAADPLEAPKRGPLLDLTAHRMTAASTALGAQLARRCVAAQFQGIYGRTPAAFADGLAQRADCIGGSFYIQTSVLCPGPVCGNGIIEPGEDCDDGNIVDGDACPSSCAG
jgi:cysteine-rich repeat protein